jgi:mRNA-degrading endonuclease RelE of RelBE toxin-antitoxin system
MWKISLSDEMTYSLLVSRSCKKEIKRLCKKNQNLKTALTKKLRQVIQNPHHIKPLKKTNAEFKKSPCAKLLFSNL